MKYFLETILVFMFAFLISSCNIFNKDDTKPDPNTISGDTNVSYAQPGNQISSGTTQVGQTYYQTNTVMTMTKNEGGVVTIKVTSDISKIPGLAKIYNVLPTSMKDSTGKINATIQGKITVEGIQDMVNKDHKPHTIAKFEGNVGDQYSITNSTGKNLTRTIVSKSTTDDFPYGLMAIKTIGVEQPANTPGIKKYIYQVNHKFGLVCFEVVMEDGTSAKTYFFSQN